MSDLISRKELLKCFCINKNGQRIPEVDCDNIEVTVSIKDVKRIIREQPTAFDTEKVVERLESEKIIRYGLHTEETDIMKIDDAIDIVKKGGVE